MITIAIVSGALWLLVVIAGILATRRELVGDPG